MPSRTIVSTAVLRARARSSASRTCPSSYPCWRYQAIANAGGGVEVALLLVEHLVEDLVDPRERRAHRHRRAVVLDHLRVAREHRHPGADRGLRQVDRRDRALLEFAQRVGQLVVQRRDEATAVVVGASSGRGRSARTIEEARAFVPTERIRPPRSLRIGQVAVIAQPERIMPSSSVSQPVEAVPSSVDLGLLERVVDGDRKVVERGLSRAREHTSESRPRRTPSHRPCRRGGTGWRRAPPPSDEHRAQQVGMTLRSDRRSQT